MASIVNDPNDRKRLQFVDVDGRTKTIRLGKLSKRDADFIKNKVENLLSSKFARNQPDRETSLWVASIGDVLKYKLAKFELIDSTNLPARVEVKSSRSKTLSEFLQAYKAAREKSVKPATLIVWQQVADSLLDYMPKGIKVRSISVGNAKGWIDFMREKQMEPTTIYKRLSIAKQFFTWGEDHNEIGSSPFKEVKIPRPKKKSNVEVPREWILKVLEQADPTWKAIISLSRFGGLRCPSEVLSLKWEHIDFDRALMRIPQPKLEGYVDRDFRDCPLFPEVRSAIEHLPRIDEYVINRPELRKRAMTKDGWSSANLSTHFLKLIAKAKLKPWKRIFHSMRASRQTEVQREFGLAAACAWVGNTEEVARESYLLVLDEDWAKATGNQNGPCAAKSDVKSGVEGAGSRKSEPESKSKRPRKKHDS